MSDLFEWGESNAATERGIKESSDHAGEKWNDYAKKFVKVYLMTHETLFSDDLWEAGMLEPATKWALGGVIRHALRQGWIEEMTYNGYILSKQQTSGHTKIMRVWRSLLYEKK